jgi:hypothetical protein
MIDYYETRSQPITRIMVWQAYKKVKSNKGGSGEKFKGVHKWRKSIEELAKELNPVIRGV